MCQRGLKYKQSIRNRLAFYELGNILDSTIITIDMWIDVPIKSLVKVHASRDRAGVTRTRLTVRYRA